MKREPFVKRFILPAVTLFAVIAVSFSILRLSWRFEGQLLHHILLHIFGILLFVGLGFGTLYVYPLAFFRGAGVGERIVIAVVNPLMWATKEVIVLTGIYSLAESLYFYLNPTNCLLFSSLLAQIGLCELLCRRRLRKRGQKLNVFSFPAALALVLGMFSVILMFAWGLGANHFYIFQEGYKAIWGYGVGI